MHCAVNSLPPQGTAVACGRFLGRPVKCGGALWGLERTRSGTHAQARAPPPLATAAMLREAAVPLADQILSVAFPLINGHLLLPFSLHGYTLSLCSSNHLIAATFDPAELIRRRRPAAPPPCFTCLPRASWGDARARKQTKPEQAAFAREADAALLPLAAAAPHSWQASERGFFLLTFKAKEEKEETRFVSKKRRFSKLTDAELDSC